MGYGDLFLAALLGALLAITVGRSTQTRAAALAALLALSFDLLFFVVDELPATLPVALTLIIVLLVRRRGSARRWGAPTSPTGDRARAAARSARTPTAR